MEDKKDKPKSKGSVLYDAPKGGPKHGARKSESEKPAADMKPKADAKPDGKDPTAEKAPKDDKGNAKAEAPKDQKGEESAKKDAGGEAKPKDDRAEMHRRHEAERRDFHNNHREAMRQMTSRHEKEIKALNEKGAGTAQPAEKVPGNDPVPAEAQAPAAAAPVA